MIKLAPLNTIANCYGTLKIHKESMPLRPIFTGFSALTAPVEDYLRTIFEPLLSKCSFLIDSTISFKKAFLNKKTNFDPVTDDLVSFDIKSLYTSVNVPKVVDYILNLIYRDARKFFPKEYNKLGRLLPVPTRTKFRELVIGTLTQYTIFRTKIGVFKQEQGLPMGGRLSPIIANLFINMLEDTVVKKLIKEGKIKFWKRFADDILCIVSKDATDTVFSKLNNWDQNLIFTIEK